MKYIVTNHFDDNNQLVEEIFTFPQTVDHNVMMEVISRIKKTLPGGSWTRIRRVPVSAGFVDMNGYCYGCSETLNLGARTSDAKLLTL